MRRWSLLASTWLLLLVTARATLMGRESASAPTHTAAVSRAVLAVVAPPAPSGDVTVQVWFPRSADVRPMPLEEFLLGVVAAEMKAEFADEALKAQFVAARTYTVFHMHHYGGQGCPTQTRADICAAPETGMAYVTLDEVKVRLGERAAAHQWQRLAALGQSTRGQILTYHGQPINAQFHSTSGSATASAAEYYGQEIPYLQSVPDPYGKEAPGYTQTRTFTRQELVAHLPGIALPVSTGATLVAIARTTPSGRVGAVKAGDSLLTARDFRTKLGLRSTQFTLRWQDGKLVITTNGYGHGVGLSQWGANGMATHGSTYEQILHHYYQGVKLESVRIP